MKVTESMHGPPTTRLRPLHSHQQLAEERLGNGALNVQNTRESTSRILQRSSSIAKRFERNVCIRAFVKLVSCLVILDTGERYCIQDSARGGYILARSASSTEANIEETSDDDYSFIELSDDHEVPSDFSVGEGKELQLHFDEEAGQVWLATHADMVPAAALEAVGCMLDDILLSLQHGRDKVHSWTKPSVLNFPPEPRPLSLSARDETMSARLQSKHDKRSGSEPALLHRWYEKWAEEVPDRIALDYLQSFGGERTQLSYQQVEVASNSLATELIQTALQSRRSLQPQPQSRVKAVAVLMGSCPELYISYLAVLKAGFAFCPILVDAPEKRKEALIADLKPAAVVVATSTQLTSSQSLFPVINATPHLALHDDKSNRQSPPSLLSSSSPSPSPSPPPKTVAEDDAAYVLYTSGTTGTPKGVIVSHISAACTISALSAHYGFTSTTSTSVTRSVRWFQGAAPTFDISIFEIFWTLSTGSTLCCAPRELFLQDPDKVLTTLGADITNITPSFASLLNPASIRGLMVGGETVNARLLQDFACLNPTLSDDDDVHMLNGVYNGYGPTETAIYCIAQAHMPKNQRGSVIGTPIATCGCLIIDERTEKQAQSLELKPLPMGAIGELIITGPQVSRSGYLNRPDETAHVFLDDPRWGRVYRTGDRARIVWDTYGQPLVEFLGRMFQDQVKLSGRRVELSEIENVLASRVEGIRETLCCVWKQQASQTGSERVVSLVVLNKTANLDFESVRQRCSEAAQQHLPDYMRPFKTLQVDALPRSASGKVDRRKASTYVHETLQANLGSLESEHAQNEHPEWPVRLLDPRHASLEKQLLDIVSNTLNDVSTTSNITITATTPFAEMGMDSLRAMRLLRNLRRSWRETGSPESRDQKMCLEPSLYQLLDSEATVRSVFFDSTEDVNISTTSKTKEASTRSQLANFASRHMSDALEKLSISDETDIEMILPTTCTQSQLAMSLALDSRNYISHSVLKLKWNVSIENLKRAIEVVVSRQPIYRSAMLPCDDPLSPFLQVILTPDAWQRLPHSLDRIVHKSANAKHLNSDSKVWLDSAEDNLNLDSHALYHIQIIEAKPESNSELASSGLLVISIAHCICDGASLEVLMTDIAREYAGMEPLPRQGILEVVSEWASNLDSGTDELWQESLRDWEADSLNALSGNNTNISTTNDGYDYGMVQYVSDLQWWVLEEKSRALGASPLAIIQASWSLLLHLFSEADSGDISFGSVIAGHHQPAHAPNFSVLPCRVALSKTQTVQQLVDYLVRQSKVAQIHRHTSFGIFKTLPYNTALALQAYSPPDVKSEHGVGETIPVPWTDIQNPAIRYDVAVFAEILPTSPQFFSQNGEPKSITFKLTYRDDSLSELSATCIAKQFAALTEIILSSSSDNLVQKLPALMPRSLLSAEGTTQSPGTRTGDLQNQSRLELLHSQFENQATLTPDRVALSFYTSLDMHPVELSYAELDARANALANIIREEDADIIPICLQRSVELYVAVLAILKAGSAWCPIDDTSPVQRKASLIARTGSKILLTTTESLPLVQPCLALECLKDLRVLLVDHYAMHKTTARSYLRRSAKSSHGLCGRDLAYLLWTSGTTGEPKGVMIQHAAATRAMRDLQVQVTFDKNIEQVRTLQLSSYSFDVFVQDLFYTWGLAGSVISGTRELVLGTFVEFIWKSRPTHAHLTPSFGASINVNGIKGSTLRYVTFIGEKLTEDVAEAWTAPDITTCAYNTYGPAENAVVSTMRQFHGRSRDQAKAANVGFPLTPCTAYVVREVETPQHNQTCWELVPRYGVGELALGGAQVAKGYLGDEAKTAKAFIQGVPGIYERIYLTGDMVRLNDHGLEFLGRNDDLVKIAGVRIELSEISAACARIKDDEAEIEHVETMHLLRPDVDNVSSNKVIVTFISVKKQFADVDKIRYEVFRKAREMLPAYMVPGHIIILGTSMPRTASNKVDRKALQEIYKASDLKVLAGNSEYQEHTNSQETLKEWNEEQLHVLEAIAENFRIAIEPLSPKDSLAGLGFSSLQVTKLAWSLRRQLKCEVGVIDLMRCQYLGELVDVVLEKLSGREDQSSQDTSTALPAPPVEVSWVASIGEKLTRELHGEVRPVDTSYILPATPIQESLVVETMLDSRAYWSHRVFDLSDVDEINTDRLKKAWTTAAKMFDILRTIFVPLTQLHTESSGEHGNCTAWARRQGIQSSILQLVRYEPTLSWTCLSGENQRLPEWAEKLQYELRPISTTQPLWSVTFAEQESKMMLSMHHALYDNVASAIILDTVAKLYHKQDPNAPDKAVPFKRGMELGLLPTSSQRAEAVALWNNRLIDLRKTAGSLNGPFPDLTQSRQKQPKRILAAKREVSSMLFESLPASIVVSTLFQSAFGCVLASYLELKAVMFGQTVSQRILHPDLVHVLGPAIVTLPVIVRANAGSAQELWDDLTRDSFNLFRSTQYLHPVDIKKMLNEGSEGSNLPFPGLFVYHPAPVGANDAQNDSDQQMFREVDPAISLNVEHPLALNIFEIDRTMELSGNGCLISQAQLELMLDQILDQARVMLESPQLPLHHLRNRMSRGLTSISDEATTDQTQLVNPTDSISLHAFQHPEWIAIEEVSFHDIDEDEDQIMTQSITYSQLDMLVNTIAHSLASHKVNLQPDDVVALYMGRDITSLAATLAIFRNNFVYLPIDEELPSDRKQLLIHDARVKLILTTEEHFVDLGLEIDKDPPALLISDTDDRINTILPSTEPRGRPKIGSGGYLLYTSGSTGRPKGVRVSNSNLCHFITAFSARMIGSSPATADLRGAGKYLNLTSRAFDPHLTQLFVPWYLGHRVVIGRDRKAMLGGLQQIINELGITHFGSVPSVLAQMRLAPEDVPSVRVITTGGEKASNELLNTWSKPCDPAETARQQQQVVLFNFYGPTEVTIGCLGHAVTHDSNSRNLGLPLQGLQALLLCPGIGDEQIIARRGEPGELCIAGPQVAMGYLNRPNENAKSLATTSLLGIDDKRIYRTGDIMRMMHDGTLEFLGRIDQQVKIRGQRLELDEVLSFLKEAAGVEGDLDFAATIIASGDAGSNEQQQQLFGFIARSAKHLLKREAEAEVELLHNHSQAMKSILHKLEQKCDAGLPAFMVPTLLWISRIPYQAAAGKVDAKLLTKLANEFLASQDGQEARSVSVSTADVNSGHTFNARECVVVAAVEEAVNRQVKATASSSIHHLGIDSLSAVHLTSILRNKGFSKLKMADILSPSCTVGSIARLSDPDIDDSARASPFRRTPSTEEMTETSEEVETFTTADLGPLPTDLSEAQILAVLPCLPLQSALVARSLVWLSAANNNKKDRSTADAPYVAHFKYRLSHGTDLRRWKKAVEQVVASEAMLRTCFIQREDGGQVFQVVLRTYPSLLFDNPDDSAGIVAQMNIRPPISIQVSEAEKLDETVVSLRIHHALFDGVAIDVLCKRIQEAYNGQGVISAATSKSLGLLTSISNHCHPSATQTEPTKCSWQGRLRDVRPCRIKATGDRKQDGVMVRSTRSLPFSTSELKANLQTLPQGAGVHVSVSSVLQLAFAICLIRLTRQTSVVYGFVMSLRPLLSHLVDEVDTFIGPCLNTIVQTFSLQDGNETLPGLAQRMHKAHLGVRQGSMPLVSVEQVQRWAGSEDKLFDSLLNINATTKNESMKSVAGPGCMIPLQTQSKSDMALAVDVDLHMNGKIVLTLSSAGVLTESQLVDVGQLFEEVVCNAANGDVMVKDFVSNRGEANGVRSREKNVTGGSEFDEVLIEQGFPDALACVQSAICRILRLQPSDISGKAKTTTLYQLGLDSITVLPLVKLINKSENVKLSSDAFIKARTIHGAAKLVKQAKTRIDSVVNGDNPQGSEVRHDETENDKNDELTYDKILTQLANDLLFIATPLQEGMLSASLATVSQAYTYIHTIQLSENALNADNSSLDTFFAAVDDTVRACEILRTRFMFTQSDETPWVGVVSNQQSDLVNWEVVDPGRSGTIRLKIHHALYDANSITAMWRILSKNYSKRLQGHNYGSEQPSEYLFRPFAKAVATAQKSSVAFWADLVRGYTYTSLDFLEDSLQTTSTFRFALGEKDLSLLRERCRALGVTIKAALHLAWVKVLCESVHGQADTVYGDIISTGSGEGDVTIGPTINTVPMRARLAEKEKSISVAEALTQLQKLSDDVRGKNSMASLRKIQASWRDTNHGQEPIPAGLFQSLFAFDGVIDSANVESEDSAETLFRPVQTPSQDEAPGTRSDDGPAYDDYPLIVSFHIKNNALRGKLRAKLPEDETKNLGSLLQTAVKHMIISEMNEPACDVSQKISMAKRNTTPPTTATNEFPDDAEAGTLNSTADAVLELVKTVLGTRSRGKDIGYNTSLVNVGLDSILAIRLSRLLKKQLGVNASVFNIIKGASVYDIVRSATPNQKTLAKRWMQHSPTQGQELQDLVAKRLRIPKEIVTSILPALAGQRAHLEQWLYNGKRFFEPPWVYRISDETINAQKVASCWTELCRTHEVLRTTFVWESDSKELVEVTLSERWTAGRGLAILQNSSKLIQDLICEHVAKENGKPSDLSEPPAHLSLLEASNGRAIVLRLHHALYDAWSVKMVVNDLNDLLTCGKIKQPQLPLKEVVRQMQETRQSNTENTYWKCHLSGAQDTILQTKVRDDAVSASAQSHSLGAHFKASFSSVVAPSTFNAHPQIISKTFTSAAIILAYARTLRQFTKRSRPTFGLHHASRSLSSADGSRSLDLTSTSVPTLTVTPICVDLEGERSEAPTNQQLLDFVQDYLAQLTRFAQADDVQRFCPKFNSYLNIIYPGENATGFADENHEVSKQVLKRFKLDEPLASSYFTITKPETNTVSTIEELDTSHLCPHRLFFNVVFVRDRGVDVTVSGDEALHVEDQSMIEKLVTCFSSKLTAIIQGACMNQGE